MKRLFFLIAVATLCSCSVSNKAVSTSDLDEVPTDEKISFGYGEQTKKSSSMAVSRVVMDEMTASSYNNMTDYLRGRVPGLEVTPDGSMHIRGIGSINASTYPLIILDGCPIDDIDLVNPRDVRSVDVLKDASASMYGVRGANGVIIITTKSGYDAIQEQARLEKERKEWEKLEKRRLKEEKKAQKKAARENK